MDFRLDTIRNWIPDFDERCRKFYRAWKCAMDQRTVTRMGYVKMRFYRNRMVQKFLPVNLPFNDAEHVFGMVNAIIFFKDQFGEYIPRMYNYEPQWLEHIEEAIMHEIGETAIGDWTEDGSYNPEEKDRLEQLVFDDFMELFPPEAQERHQRQFAKVRDNKTIVKLFDKEAFILGIGYFKSKGIAGNMRVKKGITEQDRELCRETGSKRSIDNIFVHMLKNYKDSSMLPFFVGINEAIYAEDYQELDPLVEDCVVGAPPPGVKKFYDR